MSFYVLTCVALLNIVIDTSALQINCYYYYYYLLWKSDVHMAYETNFGPSAHDCAEAISIKNITEKAWNVQYSLQVEGI